MQNERIIMQTQSPLLFLVAKEVNGKNGVYYLYTFMKGQDLYTFYHKEKLNLECQREYNLEFTITAYQGNNNLMLVGVINE